MTKDGAKSALVIGLVGGIASGKSFAANILVEFGAKRINADSIGHEVLRQPLVIRRLTQEFGDEILEPESNGRAIDRKKLGELVFGDQPHAERRRKTLESVVHPVIHAEAVRRLRTFQEQEVPPKAVIIDAPLLLEAKWAPMCNLIIYIDADRSVRLARCVERGWTEAHFASRESAQMSLDEKRRAATHVVNSATESDLRKDLQEIWDSI